jgi:anthranilate synthase component I
MKKIELRTSFKKVLSDVHTPVGIYLRLRDRFRDTILLESTDYHAADNSFSFIAINAIGGIEITSFDSIEYKIPGRKPEKQKITNVHDVPETIWNFMNCFDVQAAENKAVKIAQGLFGYTSYDAVQFFDSVKLRSGTVTPAIPLMRYRLYQYVIAINHFKDEMYICENHFTGIESELSAVESLIMSKDIPVFPFMTRSEEQQNITDEDYKSIVQKGVESCLRGDVFQIVLSRRFFQKFTGDEFNVYRALRSINPSPYLFYFDYGDYKLMGSSPESQLIIKDGKAIVHPIAGTIRRTGDEEQDKKLAAHLLEDAKENAEHVMLVDLARNDLSRICNDVQVSYYRQVHYYSHVIHLVSEVTGKLKAGTNPLFLLAATFPAGTLSGAPKYKAMELIDIYENSERNYYGGCIGFFGFDGSCNHAIMIRTFLSKENTLHYQAGAGVVARSTPANELLEVTNKLGALKQAIHLAETI